MPEISEFIEKEIERLKNMDFDFSKNDADTEKLNFLFRAALKEVW